MKEIVWGLDIGGTKCAVSAVDAHGAIVCRHQVATAEYPRWETLLDTLVSWAQQHAPAPLAAGVSCGGPLDSRAGVILNPPNLPGWNQVPVTAWLTDRLAVPAYLQNDANACALAEWQYGAGKGTHNMIFLTFGTGLGGGLILNGSLYEGANGMAGELGHIRMADDGPVGYGKAGSLEGFCSGGGFVQLSQARMGQALTAGQLVQRAEEGDAAAAAVLEGSARMLGRGIAILIDLFNPERIVIGSIFVRAEGWFRSQMQQMIEREALSRSQTVCAVVPAMLGESIGDIAAATVAWNGWNASGRG